MVLERRLDYRIRSYNFPSFPPVPIAAKGKRSVRKRNVENRMCPFDLLAAVAGKLLERDNSSANYYVPESSASESNNTMGNIKQQLFHEKKPCNDESPISDTKASTVAPNGNILSQDYYSQKEHLQCLKLSGSSFTYHSSDTSNKDIICDTGSPFSGKSGIPKIIGGKGSNTTHSIEEAVMGQNPSGCYNLDESVESDAKPPSIRSGDSIEVPLSRDKDPCNNFFPHSQNGLELLVDRDDDEKSSVCTHSCTTTCRVAKSQLGESRIRKLLASRCWKVLGTAKQAELSKTYPDMETAFCSRKISYRRQRTQRISFKRRNLFNRYSVLASHKRYSRAGVMNLFKKDEILEGSNSSAALHEVKGVTSTIAEQLSSYNSEEFHVKLSIKSFIVPELFIEIPETATVGSLKRTVMEAVTTIVESGLHVGVLLQGKNFKDDDRTLLQAGIPHANKLDELSFTLEPSSNLLPSTYSSPQKPHLFHPCDSTKLLSRLPDETSSDQGKCGSSSYTALTSTMICHERDLEEIHSPLNIPSLDRTASCQALFASPAISVEALPAFPRKAELVQRRIRRPFTVCEVEALVQAVENLGTGRWRDVKLQSFDNAKHRTYVDLKDKWKTLVHTARISPQQRRGEPVPQELLDRVLCAHAYWSKQQAKLQAKLPSAKACLSL